MPAYIIKSKKLKKKSKYVKLQDRDALFKYIANKMQLQPESISLSTRDQISFAIWQNGKFIGRVIDIDEQKTRTLMRSNNAT